MEKLKATKNINKEEFQILYNYVLSNLYTDYSDYIFNDYMLKNNLYNLKYSFDEININEVYKKIDNLNNNNIINANEIIKNNSLKDIIIFTVKTIEIILK